MKPKASPIIVLGGTGDVGKRLVRLLLAETDAPLVVLSRTAQGDTDAPDRLRHVSLDVRAPEMAELAAGATLVNLTEATPPELARTVVASGGAFLETSATPDYLRQLGAAVRGQAGPGTLVLCVGTAPGLTNLMAVEAGRADAVASVDIALEMGFGRHYGAAATEWFLKTAGTDFTVLRDGRPEIMRPGTDRRSIAFAPGERPRPAIAYGFAEQEVLAADPSLGLSSVQSFVAVDPPIVTRSLALLLRLRLGPWIARNARWLTRWMSRLPGMGQTRTRIVVQGRTPQGGVAGTIRVLAGDQAEVTAAMIVATILRLDAPGDQPAGATTIADHLTFADALEDLQRLLPAMGVHGASDLPSEPQAEPHAAQ